MLQHRNRSSSSMSTPTNSTLPVSSQDLFQHNALNHYNEAIRQLMHAYSQLQQTNLTMAGALPGPAVVPTPSWTALQPLRICSSIRHPYYASISPWSSDRPIKYPVYGPPQHSTYLPTVASNFVPLHSHAHHHRTSAPANSN